MSAERRRSLRSHSNDRNRRQSFDAPLSNQFESDYQSMPDHPSFDSGVRHRNRLYPELDQSIEGFVYEVLLLVLMSHHFDSDKSKLLISSFRSFNTADEGDLSHSDVDGNDKEYGMGGECGDDNDDELLEGEEYSRILPRSRSNSNLSYSPETGYDKVVIFSLTVLIIVMALIWFLKGGNELHQAFDQRNQAFDRYKNETGRLLKKNYPGTDVKARDILRLMGEKLIIKGEDEVEPYVVLIVGHRASLFANDILNIFISVTSDQQQISNNYTNINNISLNASTKRDKLDEDIHNFLSKDSKAVILDGIDKLRGDTPLSLQGACDPDSSPYRSSLILLTINRNVSFTADNDDNNNTENSKQCELFISNLLLNEWQSEYMNKDRISPILSRITSYVICLR